MRRIITTILFVSLLTIGLYGQSFGFPNYASLFQSTFPASPLSSLSTTSGQAGNLCTVCHGPSGGTRNSFGVAFATAAHAFTIALQNADSDGDTFSNITEINAGTFPGNAASFPATGDTTAPTVSLSAPANGASYTTVQTVAINATAADAVGVVRVEFHDGTTLLGTDTTSPYSFAWAITSANNGPHSLTARAYDAANNVGTSAAVSVTINISTTPPPSSDKKAPKIISFEMREKSSSLDVPIRRFRAIDDTGVTGYMVTESDSTNGEWSASPPTHYTFSSTGRKVLYAYARDAAGNISKPKSAKVMITRSRGDDEVENRGERQSSRPTGERVSSASASVKQVSAYNAVSSPLISPDLNEAEPVAVGPVAEGGNMFTLQVALPDLASTVDAYLTIYLPSEGGEPVHAYSLNADNALEPLISATQPWRTGVTSIQEMISNTPAAELDPGKYMIVFEIRKAGSAEVVHTWMTSFTIQ